MPTTCVACTRLPRSPGGGVRSRTSSRFPTTPRRRGCASSSTATTVGLIQYGEEPEEDFRHAWVDIFVDADRHGAGIGTDALETLVEHLLTERGHHRVTIDPAAANLAAVRCYEKAGFRRVGVMESSWRDPQTHEWIDSILMELVRLPPPRA